MFIQLKNPYFGKPPGERADVEEPNAKTLIDQGIAEAVQGDHLGSLIEKADRRHTRRPHPWPQPNHHQDA